jgi:hypothetical protein
MCFITLARSGECSPGVPPSTSHQPPQMSSPIRTVVVVVGSISLAIGEFSLLLDLIYRDHGWRTLI